MNRTAVTVVVLVLLAAAVEVALALAIAPAWSPDGVEPLYLAFLAGPLAFLALLVWRRREHPVRSRLLTRVAILVTLPGVIVLLFDYVRMLNEHAGQLTSHKHPLIIPLVQWLVILAVWVGLAIREGQEKRARLAPAKKA